MSLTFLAKSSAYSWKMSFDGHVLWKRMLIAPCALTMLGAAMLAPAATAPVFRNLRRVTGLVSCLMTVLLRRFLGKILFAGAGIPRLSRAEKWVVLAHRAPGARGQVPAVGGEIRRGRANGCYQQTPPQGLIFPARSLGF